MVELFQGLITDEGINIARDIVSTGGWKIAPYEVSLTEETPGSFSRTRTTNTMKPAYYTKPFSNIEKIGTNKILLGIELLGVAGLEGRAINEIYVTATVKDSEPFLYALIQPLKPMVFPTVGSRLSLSFILTLTNTDKADIYTIEQVDEYQLKNYQLRNEKGKPEGYAPLGSDNKIPDEFLPLRDSLPLGTILPVLCANKDYIPGGYLPCDGKEYNITEFYSFVNDYLISGKVASCTYSQFQDEVNQKGSCAKFAYDLAKGTFKVPYIADGTHIQQALSEGELSKLYEAGLPNITDTLDPALYGRYITSGDGALQAENIRKSQGRPTFEDGGYNWAGISIDASRSNPIYGKSNTVQPKSVALRYFVLVTHGLNGATLEDWQTWVNNLTTFYQYDNSGVYNRRNVVFCDSLDTEIKGDASNAPEGALWLYSSPVYPYVPMSTKNSGTSYSFPNGGMVIATSPMNVIVGSGELSPLTFTNFVGILPVSMGATVTTSAIAYFVGY